MTSVDVYFRNIAKDARILYINKRKSKEKIASCSRNYTYYYIFFVLERMNVGESYGNQNSKVMAASMQGQVGLTQWLHHHLLSHCPHCLAAELSVPCILICSVCFIQLSSREDLPLHPELSTIM